MAAEVDEIGEKLSGLERFTKMESNPSLKRDLLNQMKDYTDWLEEISELGVNSTFYAFRIAFGLCLLTFR